MLKQLNRAGLAKAMMMVAPLALISIKLEDTFSHNCEIEKRSLRNNKIFIYFMRIANRMQNINRRVKRNEGEKMQNIIVLRLQNAKPVPLCMFVRTAIK